MYVALKFRLKNVLEIKPQNGFWGRGMNNLATALVHFLFFLE